MNEWICDNHCGSQLHSLSRFVCEVIVFCGSHVFMWNVCAACVCHSEAGLWKYRFLCCHTSRLRRRLPFFTLLNRKRQLSSFFFFFDVVFLSGFWSSFYDWCRFPCTSHSRLQRSHLSLKHCLPSCLLLLSLLSLSKVNTMSSSDGLWFSFFLFRLLPVRNQSVHCACLVPTRSLIAGLMGMLIALASFPIISCSKKLLKCTYCCDLIRTQEQEMSVSVWVSVCAGWGGMYSREQWIVVRG